MKTLAPMTLSDSALDFIDDARLETMLAGKRPELAQVEQIVAKSLDKQALSVEETAVLLKADQPAAVELVFAAARRLKQEVYGNRIVLFAPLYVGNHCVNDCVYCAFRRSNPESVRRTLSQPEVVRQVEALESHGHKRLILVFGEHPLYDAEFMAETVRTVYGVRQGVGGEIRRVNINAAPLDHAGYRIMKAAGIGTYQIFQETYHHATYASLHPAGTRKADFLWRLDGPGRAIEAGCDDVGIGALFGLADWRFEVLGLVSHALHLQQRHGVGPHTISFPRLRPAQGVEHSGASLVRDEDFKRLVAVLRLAVPYTGLICTARENAELRREIMGFGVSQIDAGSRIEIGGYTECGDSQLMEREQFCLGDIRSLDTVMGELLQDGFLPSFCTACYRLGRTGEHFMEFAIPGFIKRYCTPNALTTLTEYLVDYASPETRVLGAEVVRKELEKMEESPLKAQLIQKLERIDRDGERDLYF
ncbi:[FeFe] hydrogenase H-cluster radical SAM maturase HydG [bacterium]|nr:[FeFe] hydrogenase H-cluster radical SAM maturase HydG [bacterium]